MKHMYIVSSPMVEELVKEHTHHLVLPHLYERYPEYVEAYRKLADAGAYILQDNSIFELKETVGGKSLVEYAREINATCVMVPEVLRNAEACILAMEAFFKKEDAAEFKWAACVQGKTYAEIRDHYRILAADPRIDTIAIAFNYEFDAFDNVDEMKRQRGWNRFSIVWRLMMENVWNPSKNHHLLGLFNPAELAMYHPSKGILQQVSYDSIKTNDSSSCYWHSLYGVGYSSLIGLPYKKIESHVDFGSHYEHKLQRDLYKHNSGLIEGFLIGAGAEKMAAMYAQYTVESVKKENA